MSSRLLTLAITVAVCASAWISADGQIKQHGRAIVEYRSEDVKAVASYPYSQRNHDQAWLLIEFAVQARQRIAVHRDQFTLVTENGRQVPIATQPQFLLDQPALTRLLQNASVLRQPLEGYFSKRPPVRTINFFASPGSIISDSAVTNPDEVATGDLLFKSPEGKWPEGTYRLVLDHDQARAELPILLH